METQLQQAGWNRLSLCSHSGESWMGSAGLVKLLKELSLSTILIYKTHQLHVSKEAASPPGFVSAFQARERWKEQKAKCMSAKSSFSHVNNSFPRWPIHLISIYTFWQKLHYLGI
jgi:hypothetical protein